MLERPGILLNLNPGTTEHCKGPSPEAEGRHEEEPVCRTVLEQSWDVAPRPNQVTFPAAKFWPRLGPSQPRPYLPRTHPPATSHPQTCSLYAGVPGQLPAPTLTAGVPEFTPVDVGDRVGEVDVESVGVGVSAGVRRREKCCKSGVCQASI